ncbi:hypothetical protein [Streptomyces chartreusis]|uniref:hypothetical protein n=1 Tax=Streptomyces chartreusis TaxID=1969 RepID=UPI00123E1240|nr:hypothetical protein [Streptomyces chartreusis]QEV66264.1 hypothetical protein CP983_06010 [Streptomyces chartreusis]
MTTAVREAPHHRNLTCYTDYRCRRTECVERYNERNMARLRAKKAGIWDGFVDAEPVRQHLLQLEAAGIGPGWVAATTGLSIQTIRDFLVPNISRGRGRRQRTSPDMAAKILAVTEENHLRGKVPGAGSARRIKALVAAGWPLKHIAVHAELSPPNMTDLLHRETVYASTAKAVASAYEGLKGLKPERHGVDKVQAKRARNWADRQNWPTVAYWAERMDVIDDPDFEPLYGITRRLIVAQDANEVMRFSGLNREAAAARLGVSKAYIDHAFRDHPEYAVEVAA